MDAFVVFGAEVLIIVAVSILGIASINVEVKTPSYVCMLGCSFFMAALLGLFIIYEYLPHRLRLHRQASEFTVEDGEGLLEVDRILIRLVIGSLEAFEEYVRGHKEYVTGRSRPWTVSSPTLAILPRLIYPGGASTVEDFAVSRIDSDSSALSDASFGLCGLCLLRAEKEAPMDRGHLDSLTRGTLRDPRAAHG